MPFKTAAGALAGLAGGLLSGLMLSLIQVVLPDGETLSMIRLMGRAVDASGLAAGWILHLLASTGIGALFGLFFIDPPTVPAGLQGGMLYGGGWWLLGTLALLPLSLQMPVLSPVMEPLMRTGTLAALVAQFVYGATLGVVYVMVYQPKTNTKATEVTGTPRSPVFRG